MEQESPAGFENSVRGCVGRRAAPIGSRVKKGSRDSAGDFSGFLAGEKEGIISEMHLIACSNHEHINMTLLRFNP